METNNNQNTDWFEIGGVTAIVSGYWNRYTSLYPYSINGMLYMRKIFDQFYYKIKYQEKEYVVIKDTDSKSSRAAYILWEYGKKYYFDVPQW